MHPQYETEIAFPTGEIICTDWLDRFSDILKPFESYTDINTDAGTIQKIADFAKGNISHTYVGNSSPHVFWSESESTLTVENLEYDDDNNNEPTPQIPGAVEIDHITTDLWWATIIDKAIITPLYDAYYEGDEWYGDYRFKFARMKIKPGIYKMSYYSIGETDAHIYTKFEWLRECEGKL